jgi:hypothetical protein
MCFISCSWKNLISPTNMNFENKMICKLMNGKETCPKEVELQLNNPGLSRGKTER